MEVRAGGQTVSYYEHPKGLRMEGANRMSGRHPFGELTGEFTPERRRTIDEMKRELLADMPLHELRWTRALPDGEVAITNFAEVGEDEDT